MHNINYEEIDTYLKEGVLTEMQKLIKYNDINELQKILETLDTKLLTNLKTDAEIFSIHRVMMNLTGKYDDSVAQLPESVKSNASVTSTTSYEQSTSLFAKEINEDEWSSEQLRIRDMFLEELYRKSGDSGCSGCLRGALVRKYSAMLETI